MALGSMSYGFVVFIVVCLFVSGVLFCFCSNGDGDQDLHLLLFSLSFLRLELHKVAKLPGLSWNWGPSCLSLLEVLKSKACRHTQPELVF